MKSVRAKSRDDKGHESGKRRPYGPLVHLNIPDFKSIGQPKEPSHPRPEKVESTDQLPPIESESDLSLNVSNPWISEIRAKMTLDSAKGLPARHSKAVRLHEKIIPTKENEASFRLDQKERSDPIPEDPPGFNVERTRDLLHKEYASFEFPNLKSTRDISKFDCWIEEKLPSDWVRFYKGTQGPHAKSPVYDVGSYAWEEVELMGYDPREKKFIVKICSNEIQKKVQRLAIMFKDEDIKLFEERVSQARQLQMNFDAEQRFYDLVDNVPAATVSQLQKSIKNKIMQKAVARIRSPERYKEILKHLLVVVDEEYVRAMKKCVILLRMQDPKNDHEFIIKKVRVKREIKEVPEYGTVRIPSHPFDKTCEKLQDIHWYKVSEIVQVNKIMAAKCFSFQDHRFLDTINLTMPMELRALYNTQRNHHQATRQHIFIHWREFMISETQDKMAEKFNFFAVDAAEYMKSSLHSVLRRMDLIMNTHMRNFAWHSIQDWVTFLRQFVRMDGGYQWKTMPLIILQLNLEEGGRHKKDQEAEEAEIGSIDFKPSLSQTQKFLLECIDWIVEATNKIISLEADLVPFMNIPKTPVYELTEDNPWVVTAKEEINSLFERYTEGPQEMLAKYKEFEWIGKLNAKDFIQKLMNTNPSTDRLRDELAKLKEAKDKLSVFSTLEVNFELFQIQCEKFKTALRKKIDKAKHTYLDTISKFCADEITSIHSSYDFIAKKVMTLPTNEGELFELKQFARNIKNRKVELQKQESSVIQHTLILEDYQFSIDEEVSIQLWMCKNLPTAIDISAKEGMGRLEVEEEKFREKLEREKDKWYKEIGQLHREFEKVQQFAEYEETRLNCEAVNKLDQDLKTAMDQMVSFNQRETLFELQLSDKTELQNMMDDFEPFSKLWNNSMIQYNLNEWMLGKIFSLNASLVASIVDIWLRECFVLTKKLLEKSPDTINVINHLKEHLLEFEENIPLIKSIANQAWG